MRNTMCAYILSYRKYVLSDWIHITLNYNGLNEGEEITFYLNGKPYKTGSGFSENNKSSRGRIIVGRYNFRFPISNLFDSLDLYVDELLFFNQSLTQTEIMMLSQLSN